MFPTSRGVARMNPDESTHLVPADLSQDLLAPVSPGDRPSPDPERRKGKVTLLRGDIVSVTGIELKSKDVIAFLRNLTPEQRVERAETALEIGFLCLQRAVAHSDLDFVRRHVEELMTATKGAVGEIPLNLEKALTERLGAEKGPVLAPILGAVDRAQVLVDRKLKEVERLLSEDIDPTKETSTISRALKSIRELLDPESPNSVQAAMQDALSGLEAEDGPLGRIRVMLDPEHERSIQKTLASSVEAVTDKDGELLKTVKLVVAEAMDPLSKSVDRLALAVKKEEGAAEEYSKGLGGGHEFEDRMAGRLSEWASYNGAEAEHVGGDNEPGDIVLTIPGPLPGHPSVRVVVEAKSEEDGKGYLRLRRELKAALEKRRAEAAVFVAETPACLADEVHGWGEGEIGDAPFVATLDENLTTAVRFVVAMRRLRLMAQERGEEVVDVSAQVGAIRTSLKHLGNISTHCDALQKSNEKVLAEAGQMRKEINAALAGIEERLKTAN